MPSQPILFNIAAWPARLAVALVTMLALLATPLPALAQNDVSDSRIRKIESEIRALQRKVFPGGDGRYFEPEISAQQPAGPDPVAAPSTSGSVNTDTLRRLTALETQLRRLTARAEENENALALLGERLDALEAAGTARAAPLPTAGAIEPAPVAQISQPSPGRLAAVAAVEKPATSDPADDDYVYGFRLWDARLFPEAQQQLTSFAEANPGHWRISYGRNLLGRAYLDDGKAREAAAWFLSNYNSDKQGARAGDSLLYLAVAMIALEDIERACIALAEFGETYPALATGRLKSDYDANRARVTCN